jgi:hypothetical protein
MEPEHRSPALAPHAELLETGIRIPAVVVLSVIKSWKQAARVGLLPMRPKSIELFRFVCHVFVLGRHVISRSCGWSTLQNGLSRYKRPP